MDHGNDRDAYTEAKGRFINAALEGRAPASALRTSQPKVLLFDLGGVLVENVGFERFNALLPAPMPTEELKTRWLNSPAVRSFETGSCSAAVFAAEVVREYLLPLTPEAFLEAFTWWPLGLYPGAAELLAQLRQRYTVACLSNSNPIHWQRFGGFSDHFHVSLSSHLLGTVKPDAACFAQAVHECNVDASDVVFFDDSITNVEGARKSGLRAFHVNGLAQVREVLVAEGWLQADGCPDW
jgi:putative hydrolase of the HAD superfamily